jgi:hypothetical protein
VSRAYPDDELVVLGAASLLAVEEVAADAIERVEGVAPVERTLVALQVTARRELAGAGVEVRMRHLRAGRVDARVVVDATGP